jgi:hypothetical protein
LIIAKLDAVEILDRERIGGNETVERENLVHLNSSDECTSSLSDDVGN